MFHSMKNLFNKLHGPFSNSDQAVIEIPYIKFKFKSLLSINSICLSPIQVGWLQIYNIHIITFNQ